MKEKILKILDTAALQELEKQRLTDALFVLYSVSNSVCECSGYKLEDTEIHIICKHCEGEVEFEQTDC